MVFNDDISVLSEDKIMFSKKSSRRHSHQPSSSHSVGAASAPHTSSSPSKINSFMRKRFSRGKKAQGPDDVSVSDSLCSGVLRDAAKYGGGGDIGHSTGTSRTAMSAPVPGGVHDFNLNDYNKKPSTDSRLSELSNPNFGMGSSGQLGSSVSSAPNSSLGMTSAIEEQVRREQRKERVKEKLDRYKKDQKQLKKSCVALEQQLAQTTAKLREVDSKAAFKIDSLESELRETRGGLERVAKQSTKEVTDQSECIKTLGKKLIRQAHVIKRQKAAVEQYKIQLQAMNEEMAMQDERDSSRDSEMKELQDQLDMVQTQKVQMQNLLQENIEEMMDLKSETEKDAKNIMELEFNLQQKEATLDRVAKEVSEKSIKISQLEQELEDALREADEAKDQLKESEVSVETMQRELENAGTEIDELRCKYAAWKTSPAGGGGGSDAGSDDGGVQINSRSQSMGAVNSRSQSMREQRPSILGWRRGGSDMGNIDDIETFEAELHAKDATIQTLHETCNEHEETIKTLRSDMVKMSSTYKQDSYLKRKEIAKLKQQNAEYALKLRALEKAFKCVNSTEGLSKSGTVHTMHGLSTSSHALSTSAHTKSLHSLGDSNGGVSKEAKAAAVKARLGGFAPYEFPKNAHLTEDSLVVQQANFFDADDQMSDPGGKGESPEQQ